MTVTRANVEFIKNEFAQRVGNQYVYAGTWSKTDTGRGCDCSALAAHILNGVLFGPDMTWDRVDPTRRNAWITTESWRPVEVGEVGPFGTITASGPHDIPADAAVKIALHHEGEGGPSSHMWVECDSVPMESGGSKGCATAPHALTIDSSYANDWAYLPGPIDGAPGSTPPAATSRLWGIDISNHQGEMDIAKVKAEGFDFVFAKISEGDQYRDTYWPRTRDLAREHDLILAGYHYVRGNASAESQADLIASHIGDKSIPVMLDHEEGSGDMDVFWKVLRAVEARGMNVRLSYIPDWYWERIGEPDLSAVPGLVASEYGSAGGYASAIYPGDDWHGWKPYGGRTPDILQFTDKARVAGLDVDADVFRGSRESLQRLLTGAPPVVVSQEPDATAAMADDTLLSSFSIYRTSDEKIAPLRDFVRFIDAMANAADVESRALRGEPAALEMVAKLAAGQSPGAKNWRTGEMDHEAIARAEFVLSKAPKTPVARVRAAVAQTNGN